MTTVSEDPEDPEGPEVSVFRLGAELEEEISKSEPEARHKHLYVLASSIDLDTTRFAWGASQLATMAGTTSMDRLIAALSPQVSVPLPWVLEQARRNVQLREQFMADFGALTAKEVADLAGSSATNRAQYAHALSRASRIFSVVHRRQVLFPAFQFNKDGQPQQVVSSLLPTLRERFESEWEIAFWFTLPNSWLGGERPVDLISSGLDEALIEAARQGADRGGF